MAISHQDQNNGVIYRVQPIISLTALLLLFTPDRPAGGRASAYIAGELLSTRHKHACENARWREKKKGPKLFFLFWPV